jgi:PhnB protein
LTISPPSRAAFDRIFAALAKDAPSVTMPPGETFWAERFALFTDCFGTPWMLSYAGAKAATEKAISR